MEKETINQIDKIVKPNKEVERPLKSIRVSNKVWGILDDSSKETGMKKSYLHKLLLTMAANQYQAKAKAVGGYANLFAGMVDTDNGNK